MTSICLLFRAYSFVSSLKRRRFASSSAASTSSRTASGDPATSIVAKSSEIEMSVHSPPEYWLSICVCLPGKRASISTPQFHIVSPSVIVRCASPPPNSLLNMSQKRPSTRTSASVNCLCAIASASVMSRSISLMLERTSSSCSPRKASLSLRFWSSDKTPMSTFPKDFIFLSLSRMRRRSSSAVTSCGRFSGPWYGYCSSHVEISSASSRSDSFFFDCARVNFSDSPRILSSATFRRAATKVFSFSSLA